MIRKRSFEGEGEGSVTASKRIHVFQPNTSWWNLEGEGSFPGIPLAQCPDVPNDLSGFLGPQSFVANVPFSSYSQQVIRSASQGHPQSEGSGMAQTWNSWSNAALSSTIESSLETFPLNPLSMPSLAPFVCQNSLYPDINVLPHSELEQGYIQDRSTPVEFNFSVPFLTQAAPGKQFLTQSSSSTELNENQHFWLRTLPESPLDPTYQTKIAQEPIKLSSLVSSRKPRKRGSQGNSPISRHPCRAGRLDPKDRAEAAQTRKIGACVRCRLQKLKCIFNPRDPKGPCQTCLNVTGLTLINLPCLRCKLRSVRLFSIGDHPLYTWTRRWSSMKIAEIEDWKSTTPKTIEITQDMGDMKYELEVCEFKPIEGDFLGRYWKTNGVQQYYPTTPFAIKDMKCTGTILRGAIEMYLPSCVKSEINKKDGLLSRTYDMAFQWAQSPTATEEEKFLLNLTLRLWVAIRMESRSDRICSTETLGIKPQTFDKLQPNYGQVLLPPVMSAQLNLIMTSEVLIPWKKLVLEQLQAMIAKNQPRLWFTTYLCIFILLHSCSMFTRWENDWAKKQGMETRYVFTDLVRELHHGATSMLVHFHYCNKGNKPFEMNWDDPANIALAEFDSEQLRFVKETISMIRERKEQFQRVRENRLFEHDYYFPSQLYDEDWQPEHTL